LPVKVSVNGIETKDFSENKITVREVPAEVVIQY
jgi:hypothetical protein